MGKNYSNQAGKGDKYRPVDKKKYNDNFDSIKWKSKESKEKKDK
jgi:hypothetical protein